MRSVGVIRRVMVLACLSFTGLLLVACGSSNDDDDPPVDDPSDGLSDAQRATLPDDCLLALDMASVAYCFSPADRTLMAVRVDGSTWWGYPLPGNNVDNHVEGVVMAGDALVLVADIGSATGDSGYEMSRFRTDGAFIETLPILQAFRRLREDPAADMPAWDLEEEGLLVAADSEALVVASSMHTLIDGGDRSVSTDWHFVGSSITRIDTLSGQRTAWRVLPDVVVQDLALASEDRIAVTVAGITRYYQRADLADAGVGPGTSPLDPARIPVVLPYLFDQLQAERLTVLRDDVAALFAIVVPDPVVLDGPVCVPDDPALPGSNCSGELQQGPFSWNCPASGSIVLNQQSTVSFVAGTGASTAEARVYEFLDCELAVAAHEFLVDGHYRFTGTWEMSIDDQAIRQGSRELSRFAFTDAELDYPDGKVSANGEQRDSRTYTSFGLVEKDVERDSFASTRPADASTIDALSFHSEYESYSGLKRRVSLGGSLSLQSPVTSNQSISLWIDPPLANLYWETDPVTLSGTVRLEMESGDGLTITAFEDAASPGAEQLHFQFDGDDEPTITRPFECLMISCY